MTAPLAPLPPVIPLSPTNTKSVSESVNHRLGIGIVLMDAAAGMPASGPLRAVLEGMGKHELRFELDRHGPARHAVRHAGRFAKMLAHALDKGESTTCRVRAWSGAIAGAAGPPRIADFRKIHDARWFVPRRLDYPLALDGKVPAPGLANIRLCWLFPGAAYPFPAGATLLRGRLLRGADPKTAKPIPWGRVLVTVPGAQANLAQARRIAVAFGDDRGEFVCAISARAVEGAVVPLQVSVRLWPLLPPAGAVVDANDPFANVPVDDGTLENATDPLSGLALPDGYVQAPSVVRDIRIGEINGGAANDLIFP